MREVRIFFSALCCCALLAGVATAERTGSEAELSWFAVQIETGPAWDPALSAAEQAQFKAHSAHLQSLRKAGHIVMGSRFAEFGLLVFKAESSAAVTALMAADPSMQAGTFAFAVYPMHVFYPGFVGNAEP